MWTDFDFDDIMGDDIDIVPTMVVQTSNQDYFTNFVQNYIARNNDISGAHPLELNALEAFKLYPEQFTNLIKVSNPSELGKFIKRAMKYIGPDGDYNWIDVSDVTTLTGTFKGLRKFNGDITKWDVSNVSQMNFTFFQCASFKRDLSCWGDKVHNVKSMMKCFAGSTYAEPAWRNIIIDTWKTPYIDIAKKKSIIFA